MFGKGRAVDGLRVVWDGKGPEGRSRCRSRREATPRASTGGCGAGDEAVDGGGAAEGEEAVAGEDAGVVGRGHEALAVCAADADHHDALAAEVGLGEGLA